MSGEYGLVIQGSRKGKKDVTLESVSVTGQIKGYVMGLETRLKYRNTSDDPLEVMFRFPVEESTAVVGLEAKIAGRTIKGVVREKEEARQMYDDGLSSDLTAALGEEKSGDIFSLALGNLPPKGEAELILKLVGELPLDTESEAVCFSLPTVLKPRYTPAGSSDPLAPIGGEANQVEKSSAPAVSSFSLNVAESDDVTVTSPTHEINTVIKDGSVEVTLMDLGPLDKDVVVLVHHKYPHTHRATVEEGRVEGGNELMSNPAIMLDFFPKFSSLEAACEFIFVVDRSESMSGTHMKSAKDTLILFLKSIPPGCYFNIIGFKSRYEHLFPKSVPYNQTNLDKAMDHAQGLSADLGGAELLSLLEFVFGEELLPGLPRQIFVLTHGSVSNTQACINVTKNNAHVARVFTFGIGSGASSALVKCLARAGNGGAEFIKEGERMQGKVISSLKKALQPPVTDVELKLSVPPGIEVLQTPSKIPPVFNGEKLVLYGWLKGGAGKSGPGCAVLRGKMLGSPVEHRVDFQLGVSSLSPTDIPVVHQLASKSLIQEGNGLSVNKTPFDAVDVLKNNGDTTVGRERFVSSSKSSYSKSDDVIYSVQLNRLGQTLGIGLHGSERTGQPIVISAIMEGGVAHRTQALQVGDRILAINGESLLNKSIDDAARLLKSAGNVVTLKISKGVVSRRGRPRTRPGGTSARNYKQSKYRLNRPMNHYPSRVPSRISRTSESDLSLCEYITDPIIEKSLPYRQGEPGRRSTRYTPIDPSQPGIGRHSPSHQRYSPVGIKGRNSPGKDRVSPSRDWSNSSKSGLPLNELSSLRLNRGSFTETTDEETVYDEEIFRHRRNQNGYQSNLSHYSDIDNPQTDSRVKELEDTLLRSKKFVDKLTELANHSGSSDPDSDSEHLRERLRPHVLQYVRSMKTPVEMVDLTLLRSSQSAGFGLSLSDGLLDGVYLNQIQPGGPAAQGGLLPFDKIIKFDDTEVVDYDCCKITPLFIEAGDQISLTVARNSFALNNGTVARSSVSPTGREEVNNFEQGLD